MLHLFRSCGTDNATPLLQKALTELHDGDTLSFEPAEYHFYEDGTHVGFFAPSNNTSCDKKVVFSLIDMRGIQIDGQGSTFVFHEFTSPFVVQNSERITLKNLTVTTHYLPYTLAEVTEVDDDGFTVRIDKTFSPYRIENGHLIFDRENSVLSTADRKFSLHSMTNGLIYYLFAGDCTANKVDLPAPHLNCDALEVDGGVRFSYRKSEEYFICPYLVGERFAINLEERRERDVFFLENSKDLSLQSITVRRGGGMAVIGQMCENVSIDGMTVTPSNGEPISVTADVFHFVQCSGQLLIENSVLSDSLDDACNVHGNYSVIEKTDDHRLFVCFGHKDHAHFNPYRVGDALDIIHPQTLDIVATVTVRLSQFCDDTGLTLVIETEEALPAVDLSCFYLENSKRMPDITLRNNHWHHFPHLLLSGSGKILVENNHFHDCGAALIAHDLVGYWYESGRIRDITVRNNRLGPCRDSACLVGNVPGFSRKKTPKIHGTIRVENNRFFIDNNQATDIVGFQTVICENNTVESTEII